MSRKRTQLVMWRAVIKTKTEGESQQIPSQVPSPPFFPFLPACFAKCALTWESDVKMRKTEKPTDVLPPGDTGTETHLKKKKRLKRKNGERSPCPKKVEKIIQISHTSRESQALSQLFT